MILAMAAVVAFTLPSTGQRAWTDPTQGADSIMVECSGGEMIRQLLTARLYWNPNTGGGWRLAQEHSAQGREGQPDSFTVDPGTGGHVYVAATNPAGESCASPVVYLSGSITTGIPPDQADGDRVTSSRIYDVQGRATSGAASGVYFRRDRWASGRFTVKRVVVLK